MADHAPGVFGSLKTLARDLLETGRTRLALLANEVEEEKIRLADALVSGILAVACLIVGAVLGAIFLILAFPENRLFIAGALCLLFLAAAALFAWRTATGLKRKSALFSASIAELSADIEALRDAVQAEIRAIRAGESKNDEPASS
jgi:uncharacterized membrane protein YqjE